LKLHRTDVAATVFRDDFDARYWEMYLVVSLILSGFSVTCPKPGPDVGILFRGQRIWFEATTLTPGDPKNPDFIPKTEPGKVFEVPNERMLLRYTNAVSEKHLRQRQRWLEQRIVLDRDAFVVAINPRPLPFEHADTDPPRILQAAYTLARLR
jgi:hypothetical protein